MVDQVVLTLLEVIVSQGGLRPNTTDPVIVLSLYGGPHFRFIDAAEEMVNRTECQAEF